MHPARLAHATHTYARAHTHAHTRAHTRTRTRTYTHAPPPARRGKSLVGHSAPPLCNSFRPRHLLADKQATCGDTNGVDPDVPLTNNCGAGHIYSPSSKYQLTGQTYSAMGSGGRTGASDRLCCVDETEDSKYLAREHPLRCACLVPPALESSR